MEDRPTEPRKNKSLSTTGPLTTPLSYRGWPAWIVYLLAILGVAYILNPTAGIFELLPDNLPFVGNLDEGLAFLLVWSGLVEFFEGRKRNKPS